MFPETMWRHKWLNEQKQIYRGKRPGKTLTARQIARLEKIGMVWGTQSEHAWEERYEEAREFFQEHGNLEIPNGYVGRSGKRLDLWVERQRQKSRRGALTRRELEKIAAIGIR